MLSCPNGQNYDEHKMEYMDKVLTEHYTETEHAAIS